MKRRGLLMAAAAVGLCMAAGSAALLAKPGIVRTKEGQVYDGDVVNHAGDDFVTVTERGITTRIERADVSEIIDGQGIDAEYKSRLAKLEPQDAKGRMDLARWAFDRHRYDLARDAADKALEADPNSADAVQFLTLVQSQQRMERARDRAAATAESGGAAATGPAAGQAAEKVHWTLLTDDDINKIRQEELRKTDTRVRFVFRDDVERRFLASNRQYTLTQWRALPPLQRAILILDQGAPELRKDVVITSDPAAIMEFRRLVQPMVLSTCAAAACHGGTAGGPLVLNRMGETNEAATYTNFYILQHYRQTEAAPGEKQAIFGGAVTRYMIDRAHPEDSLLLQYGLPRNEARVPHPDVPGFRPAFNRGRDDTKYQAIARWIGTSLLIDAPLTPDYGIQYDPPTGQDVSEAAATRSAAGGGNGAVGGPAAAATRPARQR